MTKPGLHTFHIPVLGLAYTIDTPVKVARYGISSVVSIVEDELIEKMREYHCTQENEEYVPITVKDEDYRARRVTAYLNLLDRIVKRQVRELKKLPFEPENDLVKYFEMLPDNSEIKRQYNTMNALRDDEQKKLSQQLLREKIKPGAIDVNIMSKIDNLTYASDGTPLPEEFSDALSAFRGYAKSNLNSSVVLSAGYNPRLYGYIENFKDFFPDSEGNLQKKIILKVSDYRSALIQGKIMAKKGVWISEFRIESGLNCGGHAFPTDGYLLGPILDEFKQKRVELAQELFNMCNAANLAKGNNTFDQQPRMAITVQGGIGTANEDKFLMEHYEVDGTGWGSPFLLVPEATNVEDHTLQQLVKAKKEDYYLSGSSPLGVPFNNFRKSTSEQQRITRVEKGRPGSPCYKKFLSSDTEFTSTPICTASRQYQDLKIKQLKEKNLPTQQFEVELNKITEKDCLCEGLSTSVYLKDSIPVAHNLSAVSICPGPNLAYFSGVFSLREMVDHIYGRLNVLNQRERKNMFINELQLYVDYLRNTIEKSIDEMTVKQNRYLSTFKTNLLEGIDYYKNLIPKFMKETEQYKEMMKNELKTFQNLLSSINIPSPALQS
jgi:hypothetical protein